MVRWTRALMSPAAMALCWFWAFFVLAALPAIAQTGTSGIEGRVFDESGSVLPGVTVTLSSPAVQGTQVAVSDQDGRYRFTRLPSGVYRLVF